jgi:hypothetical protein
MTQMTIDEVKTEMMRRKSNRNSMLLEFKRKKELTTEDMMRFGPGMSSRLKELKKQGHIIVSAYVRPGLWKYTYKGHEDEAKEYGDSY